MKALKVSFFSLCALLLALVVARPLVADDFFFGGSFADRTRDRVALDIVTKLNATNIDAIFEKLYAENVSFVDPTGSVSGRDALKAHFKGYYNQITLDNIKVVDVVRDGETRVVVWELSSTLKIGGQLVGKPFTYKGNSLFKFDCTNRVVLHRDTFDQLPLYQQIPNFDATLQGILLQYIGDQMGGGAPPPAP
jgi:hypothetical protein